MMEPLRERVAKVKRWLCPSDMVGASKEVVLATDFDAIMQAVEEDRAAYWDDGEWDSRTARMKIKECAKQIVDLMHERDAWKSRAEKAEAREAEALRDVRQLHDAALVHDVEAYRGALGYPIPGDHNAKLISGEQPICGLCDAREKLLAKAEARLRELLSDAVPDKKWDKVFKGSAAEYLRHRAIHHIANYGEPERGAKLNQLANEVEQAEARERVLMKALQDTADTRDALSIANAALREALDSLLSAIEDWHGSQRGEYCNEMCDRLHKAMDKADAALAVKEGK